MFYVIWNVLGCPSTIHYVPYFTQTFVAKPAETIFLLICIHQYYGFRVWGDRWLFSEGEFRRLFISYLQLSSDFSKRSIIKLSCPKRNWTDPSTLSCVKKTGIKKRKKTNIIPSSKLNCEDLQRPTCIQNTYVLFV